MHTQHSAIYVHICMGTYLHTFICYFCASVSLLTDADAYMACTCHACNFHTFPHAYLHTYILACIRASTNLRVHTRALVDGWAGLQHLDLTRNRVEKIPDEISLWQNLRGLFMGSNRLTAIPVSPSPTPLHRLTDQSLSPSLSLVFSRALYTQTHAHFLSRALSPHTPARWY